MLSYLLLTHCFGMFDINCVLSPWDTSEDMITDMLGYRITDDVIHVVFVHPFGGYKLSVKFIIL